VGFCERILDVRGIDFVCRTCAHCGEDDEYDWEKSIISFAFMLAVHRHETTQLSKPFTVAIDLFIIT